MVKTGLKDRAIHIIDAAFTAKKNHYKTKEWKDYTDTQQEILNYFTDARKSGSIDEMIGAEAFVLDHEFELYKDNQPVSVSIGQACENISLHHGKGLKDCPRT